MPHIYASNEDDAFLAQGFDAARDSLFQIDLWRRRGLGQLAEVFGPAYVEQDRATRLFLYQGDMQKEWQSYSSDAQRIAERLVLNPGGGVIHSGASHLAVTLAEQVGMPTTMTLMALGAMPAEHPLSIGMHAARYIRWSSGWKRFFIDEWECLRERSPDAAQRNPGTFVARRACPYFGLRTASYQVCLNQREPCAFDGAAMLERRGQRGHCAVQGFSSPIVRSEIAIKLRSA